jgi:precorrin-3B synthase
MSPELVLRKGWCPGALRPMHSGDGLLVRVRPPSGMVSVSAAAALAELARRHGNGAIDLTQRANLQLRGIRTSELTALSEGLAKLGMLDATPEAEAVRNVVLSPLSGFDPESADGCVIARYLDQRLRSQHTLHALPGKFGFAIDGGGGWPLGVTGLDVTLATQSRGEPWRLYLDGARNVSAIVAEADAVPALERVASNFLAARNLSEGLWPHRMRALVEALGAGAILTAAGLGPTQHSPSARLRVRPTVGRLDVADGLIVAAVGLPFGRLSAAELYRLSTTAGEAGAVDMRLTPWRSIFVICPTSRCADAVLDAARVSQLLIHPNDPRMSIDACPGAPACSSGETPAREDAANLAARLNLPSERGLLHVSGCAKGCARKESARVTLIGRGGHYDLVINGTTRDQPTVTGNNRDGLVAVVTRVLEEHRPD